MKTVVNLLRKYRWIFKIIVFITLLFVPLIVLIESIILKPVRSFFNQVQKSATLILWSAGM